LGGSDCVEEDQTNIAATITHCRLCEALLPDTELAGAVMIAENIRLSLLDAKIQHSVSLFGIVTISSGVVSTCNTGEENYKDFLLKADRLLYAAKSKGRNRVEN
jgi:diguanylate cyclase (GGDEF)-like protein